MKDYELRFVEFSLWMRVVLTRCHSIAIELIILCKSKKQQHILIVSKTYIHDSLHPQRPNQGGGKTCLI